MPDCAYPQTCASKAQQQYSVTTNVHSPGIQRLFAQQRQLQNAEHVSDREGLDTFLTCHSMSVTFCQCNSVGTSQNNTLLTTQKFPAACLRQRDFLTTLVVPCWLWEAQNTGSEQEVQKTDSGLMGHSCLQQMDH